MITFLRTLLCLVLLGSSIALAEGEKSHEQLTAETRALMEEYFEAQQANDWSALHEFVKFYHKDLKATYYRPWGIFTFTSAQHYYDTFNPDVTQSTSRIFDYDYRPWSESILMLVDGENAVTRYVGHARTLDGEYHNEYIHMYKVRDGKIVEFHAHINPDSSAFYARNRQFLKDLGLYKGDN